MPSCSQTLWHTEKRLKRRVSVINENRTGHKEQSLWIQRITHCLFNKCRELRSAAYWRTNWQYSLNHLVDIYTKQTGEKRTKGDRQQLKTQNEYKKKFLFCRRKRIPVQTWLQKCFWEPLAVSFLSFSFSAATGTISCKTKTKTQQQWEFQFVMNRNMHTHQKIQTLTFDPRHSALAANVCNSYILRRALFLIDLLFFLSHWFCNFQWFSFNSSNTMTKLTLLRTVVESFHDYSFLSAKHPDRSTTTRPTKTSVDQARILIKTKSQKNMQRNTDKQKNSGWSKKNRRRKSSLRHCLLRPIPFLFFFLVFSNDERLADYQTQSSKF